MKEIDDDYIFTGPREIEDSLAQVSFAMLDPAALMVCIRKITIALPLSNPIHHRWNHIFLGCLSLKERQAIGFCMLAFYSKVVKFRLVFVCACFVGNYLNFFEQRSHDMILGLVEDYILGDHRLLPELLFALACMLKVFSF